MRQVQDPEKVKVMGAGPKKSEGHLLSKVMIGHTFFMKEFNEEMMHHMMYAKSGRVRLIDFFLSLFFLRFERHPFTLSPLRHLSQLDSWMRINFNVQTSSCLNVPPCMEWLLEHDVLMTIAPNSLIKCLVLLL